MSARRLREIDVMSSAIKRIALVLVLISSATVWAGNMYKWVDAEGVVHFSDGAPDDAQLADSVETRPAVSAADQTAAAPPAVSENNSPPAAAVQAPRRAAKVEVYTASWCGYCQQTKNYLRQHGIHFTEYDIEKDPQAARRLRQYNPRGGIPVTVIDGKPIIGYAPQAFAAALGLP
jgi:glutaredoxin-like YruB-family protein